MPGDNFVIKAPTVQQPIVVEIKGEDKLVSFSKLLNNIANGSKLHEYWGAQEQMIQRVTNAYGKFVQVANQETGGELIKSMNALKAVAGDEIPNVLSNYGRISKAFEEASANFGHAFSEYTAPNFKEVFASLEDMKAFGLETETVIKRIGSSTNVQQLQQQLEQLTNTCSHLRTELRNTEAQRDSLLNGTEISRLKEIEKSFNSLKNTMASEFKSFLTGNDLDSERWGQFSSYFDQIYEGSMTAKEAITQVRTELIYMFREGQNVTAGDTVFSSAQMQDFIAKLDDACTKIEQMRKEMQNLTSGAGLRQLAEQMSESEQYTEKQRDAIRSLIAQGSGISNVTELLGALIQNFDTTDERVRTSVDAFRGLLEVLSQIAQVDPANMSGFNDALKNLHALQNLNVDTAQLKKLATALQTLGDIPSIPNLSMLGSVDLRGFNNVKISTTLGHLVEYLPPLSQGVDVAKLEALSHISLANFSQDNLKISKASMDHLRELMETIRGDVNKDAFAQYDYSAGTSGMVESIEQVAQKAREERQEFKETNAVMQEHVKDEEAAAKAEDEKRRISELLAEALKREEEATKKAGRATQEASEQESQYVNTTMKRVFDMQRSIEDAMIGLNKLTDGKQRPEYRIYGNLIGELEEVIQKYYKFQEVLAANPDDPTAATQMFNISEVWNKIADVAMRFAEARDNVNQFAHKTKESMADSKAAAREFLKELNELAKIAGKGEWGTFSEQLKKIERDFKAIQNPSDTLKQKMEDLRSILNTLSNANADPMAKLAAYNKLQAAIEGISLSIRNEVNAERDAASAQKTIETGAANAAKEIEKLNAAWKNLGDKSKFDTSSFDRMRELLEQVNNQNLNTTDRQTALQQLNDLILQTSENMHKLTSAEKEESNAKKQGDAAAKQKAALIKQLNSLIVQCTNAERKYAIVAKSAFARESYKGIQDTKLKAQELLQQLNEINPKYDEISTGVRNAQVAFSNFNTTLKTGSDLLGNYLTTGMSQLKSRLTYTFGLAAMVYKAVGEVKKMVTTAVELDSAMNELQIVTRSSGEELAAYGTRVSAMAKETAQATKDLIDATTVYARLGYSMDDSAVLSKYTAMLQGVGDIEAGAAQDAMTAILKAFNVNIDEVESVMDKLVVVGNNFPISVSQLAEGMNNAGSMLAVAGNTFEESIALLTASNATVQNISKASTGLRTIAARIRKMKTEDGEIVEESKYNAMIDALTRHNVALVDANGEYRKTYDIIKDIAGVWGQMTSMQKSAVVEALAGTRQQNIFASLMTQFDDAEKAMKRMETAAGELQDSYDIYLNSIKAHTQQLKAAFDELSVKVVNSDFVKGVVDFVRKLVEGLSKLVDSVGTLGVALAAFGSLAIIKFIAGGGWVGFVLSLTKAVLAIVSVAPHLLAFAGLFASILLLVKAWRQAHPSMDTLVKEADAAQKKVDELNKTLESNKQRIEELNKLKTDGSITEAQEKELAILKQQTEELKAQLHVTQALADTAHANVISKVHGDVNAFFNAPTQGRYLGEGAGEGAIYEQEDPAAEKLRRDLERYQELQKEIDHVNTKIGFANREYEDAVAFAEEMQAEVAQKNVDLSRTVFGNIDTENRLRLEWTKDTVKQYKDILQGYLRDGEDVEDWIGSYSTVLGQWENFDVDGKSIPIAFSPILQTMNGPVLLDDNTVSDYINDVIHEAERRGDTSAESLLKIDASGLFEHDGMMLWGLIADIGDEAERVSEIMHYVGTDGALIDATQTEAQTLQNINSILQQKKDLEAEIAQISGSTAEKEQQLLAWRQQLLDEDDSESIELLSQLEDALDDIQKVTKKDTYEVEKFKRNLDYLDKTVRNNLAKGIKNLSDNEMQKFDEWLKRCGYDIESFNKILAQMGKATEDVDLDSEGSGTVLETHISQWGTLTEEIQKATAAMEEYEDKMKGLKGGTLAERLQEGWADTMDEIAQGRANSDAAWAFYELLFSDEQIDAAGRNVERLAQMVASYKAIFDDDNTENGFKDDDSPYGLGQRLIHFLEDNAASYQNIRFDRDANGLTYVIADFKALADEIGWADEAFTMLIQDAQAYSDTLIIDTTQYNKLVDGLNVFTEGIDPSNINEAKDALQKFMEVAIQEEDYVGDRDFLRMLDMLNGDGYIQLDPSYYREILDQAKAAVEEAKAKAAEEAAQEESNPVINMDIDEEQVFNDTKTLLDNIQAYLNDNPRYITYLPNEYDYESGGSGGESESSGDTSVDKPSSAIGKKPGKNGGDTLVNELGPELISDNGRAFIANGGKPGFVKLSDNAIVFTANETKDILKGKRNVNARAYASGNVGRGSLVDRLVHGSVNARAYIRCPVCGTANPDYRASCYNCGASLHGGSAASVNNSRGTTGSSNAGVNRSAYGSPTAVTTGQNHGGNGYYYNPSTQTITYTTYTYDENSGLGIGVNNDYKFYESMYQAAQRAQEKLEAELYKARQNAAIAKHKNKLNETKRNTGTNKNKLSGTGGGNYVGGSDYQSYGDPQKVDWVAVRINRIERAIADLEKIASSGFKKLDTRLRAARDQISKTTDQIKVMNSAYDRYIQEANSVGLSENIAHLVREGTIDINSYDEETRKQIDEYTEW